MCFAGHAFGMPGMPPDQILISTFKLEPSAIEHLEFYEDALLEQTEDTTVLAISGIKDDFSLFIFRFSFSLFVFHFSFFEPFMAAVDDTAGGFD